MKILIVAAASVPTNFCNKNAQDALSGEVLQLSDEKPRHTAMVQKWNWNAILHEGAQYNRLYKAVPVHSHTAILWGRRANKRCQMQQPQLRGNMKDRFYKSILINLHVMQPLRQNIMPSKPLRPLFSCKTCKQMQQRSVDHWDWGISSTIDLIVRLYCHTRLATHRPISSVVV